MRKSSRDEVSSLCYQGFGSGTGGVCRSWSVAIAQVVVVPIVVSSLPYLTASSLVLARGVLEFVSPRRLPLRGLRRWAFKPSFLFPRKFQ